ncbi:MAG TPA: hypothetical protein VEV87_03495 [Chitinophagaceae bacterium]|nr:hypothetical protein [Chitinophagaceae bacterium]
MKSLFVFFCFLFLILSPALSQSGKEIAEPDEEFNLFLFTLAMIFVCAVIGAAIIGGLLAALVLFFLFALIAFGVLSTSVAIGLYRRSYSAGFKSFLIILFALSCAVVGTIGVSLVNIFFALELSRSMAAGVGFLSGAAGGVLMGFATYKVLQTLFKYFVTRLRLTR